MEPLEKKPGAGAGAAWKNKSGAGAAKKLASSSVQLEEKKAYGNCTFVTLLYKKIVSFYGQKTIILLVLYFCSLWGKDYFAKLNQ